MNIRLNHIALCVFGLLLLAVLDSCQGIIESSGVIRVVNDGSAPINGKLDSALPDLERLQGVGATPEELEANLAYASDNPLLHVRFLELKGRMWRGELVVPSNAGTGEFELVVHQKGVPVDAATPRFRVRLFDSAAALQADAATFSERWLGVRPLWLVLVLLPLSLCMLYLVYRQNDREERVLQSKGLGAIYKLAKRKDHWEVVFGLGSLHGVRSGQEVLLLDRRMQVKDRLVATQVGEETSSATAPLSSDIRPGYYVSSREP